MNPFMNPSLFASLSYHNPYDFFKLYNFFQAQAGTNINPPLLLEENSIILPWALRKKEARDEAREEAYNRL